jgi:N-acetylmuramic acid 6-phosphate etherase
MAGYDRPALASLINKALMKLFDTSINDNNMTVTCDVDLLTVGLEGTASTENVIALIAGTGSVAMSYGKEDNSACLRRTGRVGGWGHLLGDDGSGYGIAREAIRRALRFHERSQLLGSSEAYKKSSSHLYQAVVGHFQSRSCASSPPSRTTIDFLSSILADGLSTSLANHIASVAPVILDLAQEDTECQQVIEQAVASLLEMVELLVQSQNIDITKSALVLGGGLMRDDSYRFKILDAIEIKLGKAAVIEVVTDPAATVAKHLLQTLPSITAIVGPEA